MTFDLNDRSEKMDTTNPRMGGIVDMMMGAEMREMLSSPEFTSTMENITQQLFQNFHQVMANCPPPPNPSPDIRTISSSPEVPALPASAFVTPKTRDLTFELPVTLEELYHGKKKRVHLKRRKGSIQSDGSSKVVEEKVTFTIRIEPGMSTEEPVVFEGEADRMPGFEPGDVVITLTEQPHDWFERMGDDLLVEFEASIAEFFSFRATLDLLDGTSIDLENETGDVLLTKECVRKLKGRGMPIHGKEGCYGDLFVRLFPFPAFSPACADLIPLEALQKTFPPVNEVSKSEGTISDKKERERVAMRQLDEEDITKLDMVLGEEDGEGEFAAEDDYDEEGEEEERDEEEEEEEEDDEDSTCTAATSDISTEDDDASMDETEN